MLERASVRTLLVRPLYKRDESEDENTLGQQPQILVNMARAPTAAASCLLLLTVAVLAAVASAYNDDRPIYKWSPLWFNSYLRRGVLHKRYNDDSPIYKWSPMWLDRDALYQRMHYKRGSDGDSGVICLPEDYACGRDNTPCCSGACIDGVCNGSGPDYYGEYSR